MSFSLLVTVNVVKYSTSRAVVLLFSKIDCLKLILLFR